MKLNYKLLKTLSVIFATFTIIGGIIQIYLVWKNHEEGKTPAQFFSVGLLLATILTSKAAKKRKEEETKS